MTIALSVKIIRKLSPNIVFLGLWLVMSSQNTALADSFSDIDWRLKKDKKDIQIYVGKVADSKHRAVFSTVKIKTKMSSVVALMLDLPNCRKWATTCKLARREKTFSGSEKIIYSQTDLPFPIRDRDSYSKVTWIEDETTGEISMVSKAQKVSGQYPKTKGYIRVEQADIKWKFVPTDDGYIVVESYAHVDPNGALPVWLSNRFLSDEPHKTLRRMRKLLQSGAYDQALFTSDVINR